MKIKEWFKKFFAGFAIGVGAAIPGVSGGTIAVIFKIYEKLIWAVSNILKHFKDAFRILLPILIGVIVALIPMVILMKLALESFLFGIVCLFAGFILGSFPSLFKEINTQKPTKINIICLIVALIIAMGLGICSVYLQSSMDISKSFIETPVWFYFVMIPVGILGSSALVIPGISGSMILLILGFYKPLVTSLSEVGKQVLHGDFSRFGNTFGIVVCFAIGVIVGFYLISKIMNYLLNKHHQSSFYAIIGFIIGSIISLFFNNEMYDYYEIWSNGQYKSVPMNIEIIIGIVLLLVGIFLSYLLVRFQNKNEEEKLIK